MDSAGNILFADTDNNRIRKIAAASGIITTIAGNGVAAFSGDNALATSASAGDRTLGLGVLRTFGSEKALLRLCYRGDQGRFDVVRAIFGAGSAVPLPEARRIYYRVTGSPYDASPPPRAFRGSSREDEELVRDPGRGGLDVAGRVRGLELRSSHLEGSVDADAALAYVEWTLVLANDGDAPAEARARVTLPPGAVVSRLTLWVNGEEREAAIGTRAATRAAYERVVRVQRDPALVTTSGASRALLQCFPVPARGDLKVKLGFTIPLELVSRDEGVFPLPRFAERNFDVPRSLRHEVVLAARHPLHSGVRGLYEVDTGSSRELRGGLRDARLGEATIRATRDARVTAIAGPDPAVPGGSVRATLGSEPPTVPPKRIAVVMDGSGSLARHRQAIASGLMQLPAGIPRALVDSEATPPAATETGRMSRAASRLYPSRRSPCGAGWG